MEFWAVKILVALRELLPGEKGEVIFTGVSDTFCGDTEKLLLRTAVAILREILDNAELMLLII